ncbi:MAG: DUF4344 domain-containing metallopeptidase [Rhodobacterales bacterium]|jgi:hypothetical protein|nr:hypothetical protein [Rhodobacter sp.]
MRNWLFGCVVSLLLAPLPGAAQSLDADQEDYIRANAIFFLYHELGHALIDILKLPVFGREEDAADVMGVVLSETINPVEDTETIMLAAADNFAYMAEMAAQEGYELAFWDTHGLDKQRFYTILCLFYGANPETRQKIADEQGLPADRQATCPAEFELAEQSWGPVLDDIKSAGRGDWLHLSVANKPSSEAEDVLLDAVTIEVGILNEVLDPGQSLDLVFGNCGEANAYYDPSDQRIVICTELAGLFND